MQRHGIRAKQAKQYKATTKRNENHSYAPNHLAQDFRLIDQPRSGVVALLISGRPQAGYTWRWSLSLFTPHGGLGHEAVYDPQLVQDAFQMVWRQCHPTLELTFHSDQGSQYTRHEFQRLLRQLDVRVSMSGRGHCYDNAVVESFFSTLKMELVHHAAYQTRQEVMTDIFFYMEGFYNRHHQHSSLGYVSPLVYETRYYQQLVAI